MPINCAGSGQAFAEPALCPAGLAWLSGTQRAARAVPGKFGCAQAWPPAQKKPRLEMRPLSAVARKTPGMSQTILREQPYSQLRSNRPNPVASCAARMSWAPGLDLGWRVARMNCVEVLCDLCQSNDGQRLRPMPRRVCVRAWEVCMILARDVLTADSA